MSTGELIWCACVTSRDPNTIFRGNTLVSKCMDELMKLAGLHYLHWVLRPVVERVHQERRPCEVSWWAVVAARRGGLL